MIPAPHYYREQTIQFGATSILCMTNVLIAYAALRSLLGEELNRQHPESWSQRYAVRLGSSVEDMLLRRNDLRFMVSCSRSSSALYRWVVRESSRIPLPFVMLRISLESASILGMDLYCSRMINAIDIHTR